MTDNVLERLALEEAKFVRCAGGGGGAVTTLPISALGSGCHAPRLHRFSSRLIVQSTPHGFGMDYESCRNVTPFSPPSGRTSASYLELALRERLPLATQDEVLRQAASKAGVGVR